jgi:hypothetical protein
MALGEPTQCRCCGVVAGFGIIEFIVDDVDRMHENLTGFVEDFVNEPTTMPWGNRSLLFRDPDGNLVNCFAPVSSAAIEKFGRAGTR